MAVVVAALAAAAPAHATFPGANGKLVVSVDTCEFRPHLRAYGFAGDYQGPLTQPCEELRTDEHGDPVVRSARSPGWAPDGRRLVFVQHGQDPGGLWTMAADGTDAQPIPGTGAAGSPSFSPDGRSIAFSAGGAIWTVPVEGGRPRLVRRSSACPPNRGNCTALGEPRWSPDGRRIAVVAEQFAYGPGRPPSPLPGVWLIDARTGKLVRRVVPSDGIRTAGDVDWSPDGRRLLYRTRYQQDEVKGGASGGNVYVIGADGRGRRLVIHRRRYAETVPRWSPDGRWIAWVGLGFGAGDVSFDVNATVWRVRASGRGREMVARLPSPYVEEGDFAEPELAWQPLR